MRAVIVAVFACHTAAAPPIARWTPPPAGAYHASDPFHVAVADTQATWTNPPSFWPCPIDGATFLCGTTRVLAIRGDRVEPDPGLERGRAPGTVEAIVGRWPDDAWLVTRSETGPHVSCGACNYVAQRWRGDRWEHVTDVANLFGGRWIAAWKDSLFAVLDIQPRHGLALIGKPSALATQISDAGRCAVLPSSVASGGVFVVVGKTCGGAVNDVTTWTDAGPIVDHAIPDSATVLVVATARGPTIIGSNTRYEEDAAGTVTQVDTPIARRFDGKRWVSLDAPGHQVESYAVAPDGTEWAVIVVGDEPETRDELYVREPAAAWQPVDSWRAEALRYGKTTTAWLSHLWIAEGSVWLEVTVEGDCAATQGCAYRSLLLRTGPGADPLLLARDRGV